MKDKKGMALGGVGGFNVHDAGVLAAAHECGLRPDIITCTSGAIFWTHLFLTNPDGIEDEVKRQADAVEGANGLQVAVRGYPGVFQPAYASYWMRWFDPWWEPLPRGLFDRLFPAQLYEPTRPKEFFDQMAADLGGTPTPVMFNAYAVESGRELVFCNDAAFSFIGRHPEEQRRHIIPGEEDMPTEYRRIDAEAVRAALWLSLYGFSNRYQGEIAIDGAYQRQLIMSELTGCDVIYAIKPQASAWRDRAPGNYFEVQDFNTELWLNTSFAAEVAGLWAAPRDPARGKIQITPITMHRPLGFFNYFVERLPNYSEGYEEAKTVFQRDLKASVTPAAHRAPSLEPAAAEGAPQAGAGGAPGAEKPGAEKQRTGRSATSTTSSKGSRTTPKATSKPRRSSSATLRLA